MYGSLLAGLYVLPQYYHAHITQPLLLEQLHAWGIEMSAGQLNYLLTEDQERFHEEKAEIKAVGLAVSRYFQADDTRARHQGRNGYCTYSGNNLLAWFISTRTRVGSIFWSYCKPSAARESMPRHWTTWTLAIP